ncbi:hypothetical protein ALC53_13048 [Atta colombica]|uniref:Uncharacterized protein n=1 Tax=Atta colombica TaxID=520822 RepID=A0A195AXC2_9HYME|nr:hypothetical protein ALC53_13048 [Atta colombica]
MSNRFDRFRQDHLPSWYGPSWQSSMIAILVPLACNHPLNYIRTAPTRRRERDSSDRASPNCDKPARCRDLDTIANSDGYNRLKPNRAFLHVLKIDMKCEEREKRLDIFLVAKNFPWRGKKVEEEDEEVDRHEIPHETERQRNPHRRLPLMEHVKTANNNGRFPFKEIARADVAIADSFKRSSAPHQLLVSALFTSAASKH